MSDFEAIITSNYSDGEVINTVATVRADVARDMDIVIMTDNCRGYL